MSARQRVLIAHYGIWIAHQMPMEHSNVQQYFCYELILLQIQDTIFFMKISEQTEMCDARILSDYPSVYDRAV